MKYKHVAVKTSLLLLGGVALGSNIFDYDFQASIDISFKQVITHVDLTFK